MKLYIPKIRSIYKAKPKQGAYRHCNVCFTLVKIIIIMKIKNNKSKKKKPPHIHDFYFNICTTTKGMTGCGFSQRIVRIKNEGDHLHSS